MPTTTDRNKHSARLATRGQVFWIVGPLLAFCAGAQAQSGTWSKITEYPVNAVPDSTFDITAGPEGALWFNEYGGGKIGRITTAGVITELSHPHRRQRSSRNYGGPGWRAVIHRVRQR